jgi:diguanylate cyclase (GGDEF)-like protein
MSKGTQDIKDTEDIKGSEDRNARPRPGSLLWWYLWTVTAAGFAVAGCALAGWHGHDAGQLVRSPAFWVVTVPIMVTALRPIVPRGRDGEGAFALVVFLFALLMHTGLPAAALVCAVTMVVSGVAARQAMHRNLFNAGQHLLTLGAAWGTLRLFGIDGTPTHPWMFAEPHLRPVEIVAVALAGLVYLVVNDGLVYLAVAILESSSVVEVAIADLRHLGMVVVAMVSLSPLVLVTMVHVWPLVPLFYPSLASLYRNAARSAEHEHEALHDPLTRLANRQLLYLEATKALAELPKSGGGLAMLVIDLDKFKDVNDTLGHAAGDQLLAAVADRLATAMRPQDLVARLGGDEFAVLIRDLPDGESARQAAVRLIGRLDGYFQIEGVLVEIGASCGVALAPIHGDDLDTLLRHADGAMYAAKTTGSGVSVFDPVRAAERRQAAHRLWTPPQQRGEESDELAG